MIYVRMAGGLANQIYQYMGGYALSRMLDKKLVLDISMCTGGYTRGFLLNCFPNVRYDSLIKNTLSGRPGVVNNLGSIKRDFVRDICVLTTGQTSEKIDENEDITIYDYKGLHSEWDKTAEDYYLCGNWISEEYWGDYIEEIRSIFYAPDGLDTFLDDFKRKDLDNSVGIHIRRGDFIYHGYTMEDDEDYYKAAIRCLDQRNDRYEYFVFSDDIQYAKRILGEDDSKIHFVNSMKGLYGDVIDFCCLSLCRIKVISNRSTYSKLAYDLNPKKNKFYIVKNVDDTGFVHRVRNISAGRMRGKSFNCVNLNRNEIHKLSKGYDLNRKKGSAASSIKYLSGIEECTELYRMKKYEQAEQTAHKIWMEYDTDKTFHLLYANILQKLDRENEAAIELSRMDIPNDDFNEKIIRIAEGYKKNENITFIMIPDYIVHGMCSIRGMILVGVLLRRLGYRVCILLKHDDYFKGYLKRSCFLSDQDGTEYGCEIYSINEKDNEEVKDLIAGIMETGKKNVLLAKERIAIDDLSFYKMSEKDFEEKESPEWFSQYGMSDIFRIEKKYFDVLEKILLSEVKKC